MDYIRIEDLKPNFVYEIAARNACVGVWLPAANGFLIAREKWGERYAFVEYHWDQGPPFGTVKPWREIGEFPFDVQGERDAFDQGKGYDEKEFIRLMDEFGKPVTEARKAEAEKEREKRREHRRQMAADPVARRAWLDEYNAKYEGKIRGPLTMEEYEQGLRSEGFEVVVELTDSQ